MKNTMKVTLAALFLALGLVLPFVTMQIPEIGSMLLPMHIPVLICGFVCGWKYGLCVGLLAPLLRSLIWGMPPLLPTALAMALELATYGGVSGVLYQLLRGKRFAIYATLVSSMIAGRVIWGVSCWIIYSILGNSFTWKLFVAGAFLQAIPGIVIQLLLIPPLVMALQRSFSNELLLRRRESGEK